jgi:hypothetical protein
MSSPVPIETEDALGELVDELADPVSFLRELGGAPAVFVGDRLDLRVDGRLLDLASERTWRAASKA